MTAAGVIMVIGACAALGLAASRELRRQVLALTAALAVTERMRTAVCTRLQSLPVVLRELDAAFPGRFADVADAMETESAPDFSRLWEHQTAQMRLCPEGAQALTELGCALARGDPPENAFSLCRDLLRQSRARALAKERERFRLYPALGAAAGCLLALLFA